MAELTITYTQGPKDSAFNGNVRLPVFVGDKASTEQVTIAASAASGSLTAGLEDTFVSLHAGADCWVAIGTSPTAVAASGHFMASGIYREFVVSLGQKVSVIEDS